MLKISLFGGLKIEFEGRVAPFSGIPKTIPLLAYLLLHRERTVQRDDVAFALWPDDSEVGARGKLRRHLYALRQALPSLPHEPVVRDGLQLRWNPDNPLWLDVEQFEQAGQDALRLGELIDLHGTGLLPTVEEGWLTPFRARYRRTYLNALSQLVAQAVQQGTWQQAIAYAQAWVQEEPYNEVAVRALMTARYANGDQSGALQTYFEFEERLANELELSPSRTMFTLYRQIDAEQLEIEARDQTVQDAPPLHNIPSALTSFFGRTLDLIHLKQLLQTSRLLTLTGVGGSGKTRLALKLARTLIADGMAAYGDGIYLVELAALQDAAVVAATIAEVLGVRQPATDGHALRRTPAAVTASATHSTRDSARGVSPLHNRPIVELLAAHLRNKRMLLILDNFEQIVEAAALIETLLARTTHLRVIVTSRVPLRIYGEHEYAVAPLPTPAPIQPLSLAQLTEFAAITLFVERVRLVQSTFTLTEDNSADVRAICEQLSGLPLAIELAAVQCRHRSLPAIRAQLCERLLFLQQRNRQQNDRQQTLFATIDWSFQLLHAHDRQLFVQLGVFQGMFTTEAVRDGAADRGQVWEQLERLVEHNLVQQQIGERETRFELLPVIREYARWHLEKRPDAGRLHEQHARYYLQQAGAIHERQDSNWLLQIEGIYSNVRKALNWAITWRKAEVACRYVIVLIDFWDINGRLSEATEWVQRAAQLAPMLDSSDQLSFYRTAGYLFHQYGQLKKAERFFNQALSLTSVLPDPRELASLQNYLGSVDGQRGLGLQAVRRIQRACELYRQTGDLHGVAWSLKLMGLAAHDERAFQLAHQYTHESLALMRHHGPLPHIACVLNNMGTVEYALGRYELAVRHVNESLGIRQQLGLRSYLAHSFYNLGRCLLQMNEHDEAAVAAHTSLQLASETQKEDARTQALELLSMIAAGRQAWETAARLLGATARLREQLDLPRDPVQTDELAQVQSQLEIACPVHQVTRWLREGAQLGGSPPSSCDDDNFGISVAIDGDMIVVGANDHDARSGSGVRF